MKITKQISFYKDLYKHYLYYKTSNPFKEHKYLNNNEPIPKTIHYVWFGNNPYNDIIKKCIKTWEEQEGYTIKKWDENNFPFELYPFAEQAYKQKRWAMVSDVARLHAIFFEGGIYVDTDIEIIKPLDDFLNNCDAFMGYEDESYLASCILAGKQFHPWFALMLYWYKIINFEPRYQIIANTRILSRVTRFFYNVKLNGNHINLPNNTHIFPRDYFHPKENPTVNSDFLITENTHTIHHATALW